jgi:beta-galactosidase
MSTLTRLESPSIKLDRSAGRVRLSVSGRYPRPDEPEQAFVGGYQLEVTPQGALTIGYDYTPVSATGSLSEAGLSIVAPPRLTEFRWIGQGPYAGYPGKDRLNEFGLFHLNREDLRFQGNRRGTELALLTTASGAGLALAMPAGDVAVERSGEQILLSQNALIAGLGNKGTRPETRLELESGLHIAGKFTLLPLEEDWPSPLIRWFGKPTSASRLFRPFYQSYDQ